MSRSAANTGPGPTGLVALEQFLPAERRIIHDDLAWRILPVSSRGTMWVMLRLMSLDRLIAWSERRMPGMWSGFMCRKRYIDETTLAAVDAGVDAVVNLGAGFDTRLYRLTELSRIPSWEIDQPGNIAAKRTRLEKIFGAVPGHVTLLPIDFDRESLGDALTAAGCPLTGRLLFIWEAVTQYLPESSVRATMDVLSRSATGSRLVFTYVRKDFVEGKQRYDQQYIYNDMIAKKHAWLFGLYPAEVADWLSGYGWNLREHLGYDELAERYVRPTGRELLSTPLERVVYAERM